MTLQDTLSLGEVLSKSGFFSDARQASQAVVKVLAGRELGFGPIASMTGIHIVQGKPSIGANLIGAAIKSSGKYNYRVVELTEQRAEIAFFENGSEIGRSVFTLEDAKAAQLDNKDVWKAYPRNMLFSRAMSNGARWYCPDVFGGVTPYTHEELGANVDGETGEVIDVTPTVSKSEPEAAPMPRQAATNGHAANGKSKPAAIKSKAWAEVGKEFAANEPYYQDKNGAPDWYHMTGAAGACGFEAITDDNLEAVLDALRTHANKARKQAGQQALDLPPM